MREHAPEHASGEGIEGQSSLGRKQGAQNGAHRAEQLGGQGGGQQGVELLHQGQYMGAVSAFSKALAKHPISGALLHNLGVAFLASGHRAAAVQSFKKVRFVNIMCAVGSYIQLRA